MEVRRYAKRRRNGTPGRWWWPRWWRTRRWRPYGRAAQGRTHRSMRVPELRDEIIACSGTALQSDTVSELRSNDDT